MTIFETLTALRQEVIDHIHNALKQYDRNTMLRTFNEASDAFNLLRVVIRTEENRILPKLKPTNTVTGMAINRQKQLNRQTKEKLEELVLIHVDEPGDTFTVKLKELYSLIREADAVCSQTLYPLAKHQLKPTEQKRLQEQISPQLNMKSLSHSA